MGDCSGYLEWRDKYQQVMFLMKGLEKTLLIYEEKLRNKQHREAVSRFRREIIRLRREVGKADEILNDMR